MASKHTELSEVHGADINTSSFRNVQENPSAHKVKVPEHTPLVREFEDAVKEVFFPDDPLRKFRNQPPRKKYLLGLFYIFPIFEWLSTYKLSYLKDDILAGLTIASLAVPQDLGYAKLANLQPVDGLYGSFVPPLIYAVLGSSRHIAIGPVAVVSILLGTLLKNEVDPTHTAAYLRLALTSTFFAGVFQTGLGLLRLGFIIDFLSHAAIVGFMAGAAITIGLQQLKGLLGIKTNFTTKTGFISVMRSVFSNTKQWNWETILIGLFFLAFLLITKFIGKRKKKLFWLAALAPLTSVILATAFVRVTRLDKHGVAIVGHIRKGVNPSSVHQLEFSGKLVSKAVRIGLVTGLVALTEAVAIGRTFASIEDYQLDGNKEMIALGLMNMIGSCTSCYVTTGSFSRSAVNYNAGVKTAASNIVMSITILITLVALTPLFKYTPNCILSVIVISAVLNLIDIRAAYLIWKVDKLDFLACLGAFLGVFFVSVEIGLLIAVGISLAKVLLHVTRPHTAILGNIPGTNIYRNIQQYPDASKVAGILIIRIDSSIYFSNSNYIRDRILRYVTDEEEKVGMSKGVALQFVILELSPVMSIDTTGIIVLEELSRTLQKRKIQLALANPGADVMEKVQAAKFVELLGEEWFFLTAGEAVQVCSRHLKSSFDAVI